MLFVLSYGICHYIPSINIGVYIYVNDSFSIGNLVNYGITVIRRQKI